MSGTKTLHYIAGIWVSLTLLLSLPGCDRPVRQYQHQYLQFGTVIDISLFSDDRQQAMDLFEQTDALLSTRHRDWHGWRDGELKRFNLALQEHPGQAVKIPPVLRALIEDSKKYYEISDGLFNPAIGKLVAAWGFHDEEQPDRALIERISANIPGMDDLIVAQHSASTTHPHLQLDFGAIAKGLGVHQISQLLQQNGIDSYIINAGGDVFAFGRKPDRAWRVGIEDPFQTGNVIASVELASGESIFTSGNYHRYRVEESKRRHHIIDPRTGEPSRQISAASVLHSDPMIADIAATTLMLTAIDDLPSMARKLQLRGYLVITENREAYISPSLADRIEWMPGTSLQVLLAESPQSTQ